MTLRDLHTGISDVHTPLSDRLSKLESTQMKQDEELNNVYDRIASIVEEFKREDKDGDGTFEKIGELQASGTQCFQRLAEVQEAVASKVEPAKEEQFSEDRVRAQLEAIKQEMNSLRHEMSGKLSETGVVNAFQNVARSLLREQQLTAEKVDTKMDRLAWDKEREDLNKERDDLRAALATGRRAMAKLSSDVDRLSFEIASASQRLDDLQPDSVEGEDEESEEELGSATSAGSGRHVQRFCSKDRFQKGELIHTPEGIGMVSDKLDTDNGVKYGVSLEINGFRATSATYFWSSELRKQEE